MCCIQSDLVYPDYFVSWNDVGLARYPDNGIESIKSDILSGANANYVNKGDNVHCSRTRLSRRSKSGVPSLGYNCLSEGVHWRLAIEGKIYLRVVYFQIFIYIYHLILFSKVITCLLLNVSVKNHEKILCHKEFKGTCVNVKILKGYILNCWNAVGVHAHLSECWSGTLLEKGWEPLL